jgi:hypothetical protein
MRRWKTRHLIIVALLLALPVFTCGIAPVLRDLIRRVEALEDRVATLEHCTPGSPIGLGVADILIREYMTKNVPELDSEYLLLISEAKVPGMWEELKVQLFQVEFRSAEGTFFRMSPFIFHNREISPIACAFGGFGLMSGLVDDGLLYLTYSWGSGIHRSHVAVVEPGACELRTLDAGGFISTISTDLFLVEGEDGVHVENGLYIDFNHWQPGPHVGRVVVTDDLVIVVDEQGAVVEPDFQSGRPIFTCF